MHRKYHWLAEWEDPTESANEIKLRDSLDIGRIHRRELQPAHQRMYFRMSGEMSIEELHSEYHPYYAWFFWINIFRPERSAQK